jgi:amino acid adenylation domain-containing protein
LLATQVVSRLRRAFGVEVPLRALFEAPTVAGLASRVEALRRVGEGPEAPLLVAQPRPGGLPVGPLPLSFAQQRLWFLDRLTPGGSAYNVPWAVRLRGDLAPRHLATALSGVVARHEVLRTTFRELAGEPVQVVGRPEPVALPVVDLGALEAEAARREASRLAAREAARPFDLERGPLLRAVVVRVGDHEHLVLLTMHHVVSDGWSRGILWREVSTLYEAVSGAGGAETLPELPVQYGDFALWQRSWLAGEVLAGEVAWWRERLADLPPVLELPLDRPRPAVASERGASVPFRVPKATAEALESLGREWGATPFMTLLAGFAVLLSRWTGQGDVALGTPIAGRTRVEIEGLIGFFVNTLVLWTDLSGEPSFAELVARVRETALDAYAHQDLPFEKLVEELAPERSLAHSPLFQVMFALQEAQAGHAPGRSGAASAGSGPGWEPGSVETATAKFDLHLALRRGPDGVAGALVYNTDLFDRTTVRRLSRAFATLLGAAVRAPGSAMGELDLLSRAERQAMLREWNDTAAPPASAATLPELLARQARATPERVALVGRETRLTYGELSRRAASVAAVLQRAGAGPGRVVGVLMERTADLVVALLGVLESGAAYLPLDLSYPVERLSFTLRDAEASLLLTQRRLEARVGEVLATPGCRRLAIEDVDGPRDVPLSASSLDGASLAYVIYTSGSTGRPKGVAVRHAGAVALVEWAREAFAASELEGVLASTSVCFDLSIFELFAPLALGGTVVLADDALHLADLPDAPRLRLVNTVPSVAAELVRHGVLPESLATINLAGEALPRALVASIEAAAPGVRVLNLYGPTEDTTYSTWSRAWGTAEPTIGRALPGTRAQVLDPFLRPQPLGVPGEMYLAGLGLARGYLGRPGLTAERFLPDPLGEAPGGRAYRTGDRARWSTGAELEFLGRLDQQVKVRGFRIEPGEVEAALAGVPGVGECAVVVDAATEARLVAYVAPSAGGSVPGPQALRRALERSLPPYLVPSLFVPVPALPRLPSGKLDRRALPSPRPEARSGRPGTLPRGPVEELVAGAWSEVLGLDAVGSEEDFFALGGHSLLATRVVSRLRRDLGVEVPLRALFEAPTVAALASRVAALRRGGAGPEAPPLVAQPRPGGLPAGPLPLSFAQQRLWFLDRLAPGGSAYNVPWAVRLRGQLEPRHLAAALMTVVRRHEVLRTTFREVDGDPVQVVGRPTPVALPVVDLGALEAEAAHREARRLAAREAIRPFDLERGPLLRAAVVRRTAAEHLVLFTMHHVVSDGWSSDILWREVSAFYEAAAGAEEPAVMPELPVQYGDFALWQRSWLTGEVLAGEVAWWRERLAGLAPVLELPLDRPRPAVASERGASVAFRVPAATAEALESLGREWGATPFMTLLAGFAALLGRWTGQGDVALGTPIAGRTRVEIEGLIGFFVNTLVLRSDLSGEPSFAELVARVRETALDAYARSWSRSSPRSAASPTLPSSR